MHRRPSWASKSAVPAALALAFVLPSPGPAGGPLAKDHPIYRTPDLSYGVGKSTPEVKHGQAQSTPPRWAFALDKKQFLLGETIRGRLTAENVGKEALRLSPPYRGFHVATVAVWVSRRQTVGNWSTLAPVSRINRGFPRFGPWQFQGEPVVLKAGARWEAAIAVSGEARLLNRGTRKRIEPAPLWLGGIGFAEPGHYRFYLQYVNLEELMPFDRRKETASTTADVKSRPHRSIPGVRNVPSEPVVLGPYDVEILPPDGDGALDLGDLLATWNGAAKRANNPVASFPLDSLPRLFETDTLKTPAAGPIRASLALTQVQGQLFKLPAAPAEKLKVQQDVLKRLQDARKALPAGPLRDAYGLTECYLLLDLGRRADAVALTRALQTPDARVFLIDHERDRP